MRLAGSSLYRLKYEIAIKYVAPVCEAFRLTFKFKRGWVIIHVKHVGRVWISAHNCIVARGTIMRWLEILVEHTADDAFVTGKSQRIAGPVISIDMCGSYTREIANQVSSLLVGCLGSGNFNEGNDGAEKEDKANEHKYAATDRDYPSLEARGYLIFELAGRAPQRCDEGRC